MILYIYTGQRFDTMLEEAGDEQRHGTGAHMEYLVQSYQRCKHLDAANDACSVSKPEPEPEPDNTFTCYDDEDGSVIIRAKLRAEDGALVRKALEIMLGDIRRESELKVDSTNVSAETNLSLADYGDTRANALIRARRSLPIPSTR